MKTFFAQHPYVGTAIICYLANAIVTTMPSPGSGGWTNGLGYKWIFSLLHAAIGALTRLAATMAPDSGVAKALGVDSQQQEEKKQ